MQQGVSVGRRRGRRRGVRDRGCIVLGRRMHRRGTSARRRRSSRRRRSQNLDTSQISYWLGEPSTVRAPGLSVKHSMECRWPRSRIGESEVILGLLKLVVVMLGAIVVDCAPANLLVRSGGRDGGGRDGAQQDFVPVFMVRKTSDL